VRKDGSSAPALGTLDVSKDTDISTWSPWHRLRAVEWTEDDAEPRRSQAVQRGKRLAAPPVSLEPYAARRRGAVRDGEPVDTTGRIAAALNLGGTLILGGIVVAAGRVESAAAAASTASTGAARSASAVSSAATRGTTVSRGVRATQGAFSRQRALRQTQVIEGAPFRPKDVPTQFQSALPGAKSVAKGAYGLQRYDDTCGVVVAETMRREAGLAPIADEGLATMRMSRVPTSLRRPRGGQAPKPGRPFIEEPVPGYQPLHGTYKEGVAGYVAKDGAKVRLPEVTTIKDIKTGLTSGEQVAVLIRTEGGGLHWVQVKEIVKRAGGDFVRYGDPWTGGIWEVSCRTFGGAMIRDGAVFAKWAR
jgi:hypothetical protein